MAGSFSEMNKRLEVQELLIQEQQKGFDKLRTQLLKVVESIQKNIENKLEKLSDEPLKNDGETTGRNSGKEEELKFVIDPHAEKMQKIQNQLEVLMHRKDLQEVGITRPYLME